VSHAFYEYGFTGKAIDLTQDNISFLTKLEPIVETRVTSGESLNQLLRLNVEIGKLEDNLASLKQKHLALSAELNALLNLNTREMHGWPRWDAPQAMEIDEEQLVAALIESHPELKALEQTIASEKARVKVAKRSSYPDMMLGVNYIQVGDPDIMPDTPDAGEDPWMVTAAVSIPLWTGKYQAQRKEARAREESAKAAKSHQEFELMARLRKSVANYADAIRQLNVYGEELLSLAEQAVENSRTGYEAGEVSILELIDSERSLLDLQLIYWRAAADAWMEQFTLQTLTFPNLNTYLTPSIKETL
jgi:outer membrane protein TolC